MDLSETLPDLLAERGMTQERLAEITGIKRTDINAFAKGRVKAGQMRLKKIAEALDVSLVELNAGGDADDERGRSILRRLEALEDELARLKTNRDRERRALAGRLDRIEADLAQAVPARTRRK